MTLAQQILIASVIFCLLILIVLGIQKKGYLKHKVFGVLVVLASFCFLLCGLFYGYTEFNSFKKRAQQYTKDDHNIVDKFDVVENKEAELDVLEFFHSYQSTLNGYERFLLDISLNTDAYSYQSSIREKLIQQFESEEYTQNYWNKVFHTVFKKEKDTETYSKVNYEAMYIIPSDDIITEDNQDYGDLSNPQNFNYFEAESNRIYLERKVKNFDRSTENIETLWKHNKAFIYTFFSKNKYDKLCKQSVNDLITVYDTIVAKPQYTAFYAQYDVSDEEFLSFPSKEFTSKYEYSWPFSFWDRRFTESNSEQVYSILKEIQQHYN